jgi:hypothetical protein
LDQTRKYRSPKRIKFNRNRKFSTKWITQMTDSYIRRLLSRGTSVPPKKWPMDMVELKRAQIVALRELRKH